MEAYKLLQRDSSDTTAQVLIQISQQLSSIAANLGGLNATYIPPPLPTSPFTPEQSSVWLNGLWFVALILSLVTASLGMLVKQWLREYLNYPDMRPEEERRVRLFRIRGLRKFRVSEIAAFLPLLLQMSLILFFAGLALFTRSVHATIGWVITGFVIVWGVLLAGTIALPWFSSSCPYKTPFLKPITARSKRLLNNLYEKYLVDLITFDWHKTKRTHSGSTTRGPDAVFDELHVPAAVASRLFGVDAEITASKDVSLDVDALLDAYQTSGNIDAWEMGMRCVDPQDPSASLALLASVTNRRHLPSETSQVLQWNAWHELSWNENRVLFEGMTRCIRLSLMQAYNGRTKLDSSVVESLFMLNKCSKYLVENQRSPTPKDHALRLMAFALMRGALSAPFHPGCLPQYISGLLENEPCVWRMWDCSREPGESHFSAPSQFVVLKTVYFQLSSKLLSKHRDRCSRNLNYWMTKERSSTSAMSYSSARVDSSKTINQHSDTNSLYSLSFLPPKSSCY